MKRYLFLAFALSVVLLPSIVRADCDNNSAVQFARQGYAALDGQRWADAKKDSVKLIMLAQSCDDMSVKVPSVVHSAYIGSAAMHGLGDDTHAVQGVNAGLMMLDAVRKAGGYQKLYDVMEPKFEALQRELRK